MPSSQQSHIIFVPVLYLLLAGILVYSWTSQTSNPPPIVFHMMFIISTFSALAVVLTGDRTRTKLLSIVSWALTLQIVNSYALRLAPDVLSSEPDPIFMLQLVHSILSTGFVNLGNGIGAAFEYSFYPTAQVLASILVIATGVSPVVVMKLLPFVCLPIIILLLFRFYSAFTSENDAILGTLIAASCFWFLYFESTFTQSLFGTLFSCVFLLSLTKEGSSWRIVSILSLMALASSHFLSGLYMLVVLFAAKAYMMMTRRTDTSFFRMTLPSITLLAAAMIVVFWLFYPALLLSPFLVVQYLTFRSLARVHFALSAGGEANPFATRLAGDIGIVSFAILVTLAFLHLSLKNHESRLRDLVPYSFGSAVLFAANLLAFSLSPSFKDILPRAFWYVYFISAPLVVYIIRHYQLGMPGGRSLILDSLTARFRQNNMGVKRILICLVIITILLSSMYYYYPAARYDNAQPADASGYTTVIRLSLEQWVYAGVWSSSNIGAQNVYGDKVAVAFVGGLGTKHVNQMPSNGTLSDWTKSEGLDGSVLILRDSLPEEPSYGLLVDGNQIQSLLAHNNLIYNGGDPLLIKIIQ